MEKLTKAVTKSVCTYSRLRCIRASQQHAAISTSSLLSYKWEPDDLKLEPDIPIHSALNLCLYGYDYAVLERYADYVYRSAIGQKLDADLNMFIMHYGRFYNILPKIMIKCIPDQLSMENSVDQDERAIRALMGWAVPMKKMKVNTAKPKTKVYTDTFPLNMYQRVVQLQGIESIKLPLFLEFIRQSMPEGVELKIKEHQEEDDEFLFIPDLEKQKLVKQLKELEDQTKKK